MPAHIQTIIRLEQRVVHSEQEGSAADWYKIALMDEMSPRGNCIDRSATSAVVSSGLSEPSAPTRNSTEPDQAWPTPKLPAARIN